MAKKRFEFCAGAKCAKLSIRLAGENVLTLISKAPVLTLELDEPEAETFTHRMVEPIEKTFSYEIADVENLGGYWYFNEFRAIKLDCPMPGTYPIIGKASDIRKEEITDLYWKENKLFCYFDKAEAYFNDSGFCTYKVHFNYGRYRFFDRQGVLYESRPNKKLEYKVECDACCKDDEILCDSNHFPGYTCYPIPPLNSKLLENKNNIARFWR